MVSVTRERFQPEGCRCDEPTSPFGDGKLAVDTSFHPNVNFGQG